MKFSCASSYQKTTMESLDFKTSFLQQTTTLYTLTHLENIYLLRKIIYFYTPNSEFL